MHRKYNKNSLIYCALLMLAMIGFLAPCMYGFWHLTLNVLNIFR